MRQAKTVMENFMDKLQADHYAKETIPQDGSPLTDAFVEEQLAAYFKLLKNLNRKGDVWLK